MGVRYETENPRLMRMRRWPVTGFENYLVYYRPLRDGIEIVRILHGARDIARLLK